MDNNIEIIFNSLTSDLRNRSHPVRRSEYRSGSQDTEHDDDDDDDKSTFVTHSMSSHHYSANNNNNNNNNNNSNNKKEPTSIKSLQSYMTNPTADYEKLQREKLIFQKARHYLNPGVVFRFFVWLYTERKLLTFFWIHFVATLVVWGHFAMQKFDQQREEVPEAAPRYWWKVMVPTLEFGAMHAILFQMALIPLTMSRFSISTLSQTVISRFVPMNRMLRIHIHLGYIMVGLVFISTLLFFTFFGLLCNDGDQAFCAKMKSEIMITGYIILGFLLIIGFTSHFRHSMPYEIFYGIHHLVFLLYFVTIIHTFDGEQRSGTKERSQTFKWFSSTLLYYFCDRAAMALNHTYRTPLLASSVVDSRQTSQKGSKMVILRLRRPVLFHFKPGQYAQLRLKDSKFTDHTWHPFSIASGPGSSCLEFYIEVFDEKSWSYKLWQFLQDEMTGLRRIEFEVMGPYGTALAKTQDYSHAIAIGTGTGIVPILSLFKQHVRQLLRLEPESFLRTLEERQKKIIEVECAEDERKGSIASKVTRPCLGGGPSSMRDELLMHHVDGTDNDMHSIPDDMSISKRAEVSNTLRDSIDRHCSLTRWGDVRDNMNVMKSAAFQATRSIYGVVLLSALPVVGVGLIGLCISWNTCSFELFNGMMEALMVLTVIFQAMFAFVAFCIWDASQFFALVDAVVCCITPLADWYWARQFAKHDQLHPCDITLYTILIGYMTARLWSMVVRPRHRSWRSSVMQDGGFGEGMDRLEIVWVTRSASLVSKIMPEIHVLWDTLVSEWGLENALKVCRISIHVTDKDESACELLRQEFAGLQLFKGGAIRFGRPDFSEIIENHTLDMVASCTKSYSLLAFCGSAHLAREIHHEKISNDMVAAITGNKQHQMEFVSESYGGCKSSDNTKEEDAFFARSATTASNDGTVHQSNTATALSSRRSVAYTQL